MKGKLIALIAVFLITLVAAVSALPIDVNEVEIDDFEIVENQTNRFDIVRGQAYDIEIYLTPTQDVDDVEIEAFVSGFEHNDRFRLADHLGPFDFDENVTYRKKLSVRFSDFTDEDDYKLRIVISDRNNEEIFMNFPIKVDVERHNLQIVDALFTPNSVQAGHALLSVIRVENFGERDEYDVKVTLSVPELGIFASDYIEEIEHDEEEETEELFLRIPKCTEPGLYEAQMIVEYNNGFSRTGAKKVLEVMENPVCNAEAKETVEVVQTPPQNDTVEATPRAGSGKMRTALEIILLVLVALLVVIGLIIGFSKMGRSE